MEVFTTAQQSKRDYLRFIYGRYQQMRKEGKSMMLEEFSKACGYNRKYATWLLNKPLQDQAQKKKKSATRSPVYGKQSISILAGIWRAS